MEKHAEYIRDGLKWEVWRENAERMIKDGNLRTFNIKDIVKFNK